MQLDCTAPTTPPAFAFDAECGRAAGQSKPKQSPRPLTGRGRNRSLRERRGSAPRVRIEMDAPPSRTRYGRGYIARRLVVVLAAVPLLDELVEEVRVGLGLGVGLVHGIDLGHEGVALGVGSYSASRNASMMSAMRNSPVILPPKPTTLALSSRRA